MADQGDRGHYCVRHIILLNLSHTITEVVHSPNWSDGSLTRLWNIALKGKKATVSWRTPNRVNIK